MKDDVDKRDLENNKKNIHSQDSRGTTLSVRK